MSAIPMKPAMHGYGIRQGHFLANGLVAYWPMWEGSGGRLFDISGKGRHGTINVGTWTHGPEGHSLDSWSGTSLISVSDSAVTQLPIGGGFSVVILSQIPSFGANRAVVGWGGTDDLLLYPGEINVGGASNGFRWFWRDASAPTYQPGVPHNLANDFVNVYALTCTTGGHQVAYANNSYSEEDNSIASAGPFNSFRIGGWSDSAQPYVGRIASVALYERVLTSSEIAEIVSDPWGLIVPYQDMYAWSTIAVAGVARAKINSSLAEGRGSLVA